MSEQAPARSKRAAAEFHAGRARRSRRALPGLARDRCCCRCRSDGGVRGNGTPAVRKTQGVNHNVTMNDSNAPREAEKSISCRIGSMNPRAVRHGFSSSIWLSSVVQESLAILYRFRYRRFVPRLGRTPKAEATGRSRRRPGTAPADTHRGDHGFEAVPSRRLRVEILVIPDKQGLDELRRTAAAMGAGAVRLTDPRRPVEGAIAVAIRVR